MEQRKLKLIFQSQDPLGINSANLASKEMAKITPFEQIPGRMRYIEAILCNTQTNNEDNFKHIIISLSSNSNTA